MLLCVCLSSQNLLLVCSGRLWYLALPSEAKSPMRHKISTLLKNCIQSGVFTVYFHVEFSLRHDWGQLKVNLHTAPKGKKGLDSPMSGKVKDLNFA